MERPGAGAPTGLQSRGSRRHGWKVRLLRRSVVADVEKCFAAGPNQRLDEPFGDGVDVRLTRWMFEEREAHKEIIDGITAAGAHVMGRNMFSPGRGEWDLEWKGWWGDDPPYHAPVFVLTHYPRESLPMQGGTTFHFVTDGIESALAQAREAAGEGDVAMRAARGRSTSTSRPG